MSVVSSRPVSPVKENVFLVISYIGVAMILWAAYRTWGNLGLHWACGIYLFLGGQNGLWNCK